MSPQLQLLWCFLCAGAVQARGWSAQSGLGGSLKLTNDMGTRLRSRVKRSLLRAASNVDSHTPASGLWQRPVLVDRGSQRKQSVAVCFYGLTRALKTHTYVSIQRYLLAPILHQGFHLDVFMHTYNDSMIYNPRSKELHVELDPKEYKMLEPIKVYVESPEAADTRYNLTYWAQFGNAWPDDPSLMSLRNMLRAQHSIQTCHGLIEEYVTGSKLWHYDYIIFARPDVEYLPPGLPNIVREIPNNQTLALKFTDRFALGRPDAIKLWAYRMDSAWDLVHSNWSAETHWLPQKYKHLTGLHAENLVKFHLHKHGVKYHDLKGFCFVRVRAHGLRRNDC